FRNAGDIEIFLKDIYSIPGKYDAVELQSAYLQSVGIPCEVIGFKIGLLDKDDHTVSEFYIKGNQLSDEVKGKISGQEGVKKIKIFRPTIKWFTGTFTLGDEKVFRLE
ncbi:MAG: hypothetical protein AAGD88_07160, partial [Bacteroidota bacterium]